MSSAELLKHTYFVERLKLFLFALTGVKHMLEEGDNTELILSAVEKIEAQLVKSSEVFSSTFSLHKKAVKDANPRCLWDEALKSRFIRPERDSSSNARCLALTLAKMKNVV